MLYLIAKGRTMRIACLTAPFAFLLLASLADSLEAQNTTNFPTIGRVDRFEPALDALIAKEAQIEVLCGGFDPFRLHGRDAPRPEAGRFD